MQRFDCLARDLPLFGPHLLEASAGTGKTFSIEHVYLRLILESRNSDPIDVEQILVVTFTKAATRELKARIRANFEKAIAALKSKEKSAWDYLKPYIDSEKSEEALRTLTDALAIFERCQIFTIHGFCWRMLKEFAFEAKEGFSLPDPEGERLVPERVRQAALDFLEYGVDENMLCAEQASILMKQFESLDDLTDKLLRMEKKEGFSFAEFHSKCKAALHEWSEKKIESSKLLQDFRALEGGYKKMEGDFEKQAIALGRCFDKPDDPASFRVLLSEKKTLFDFLDPSNRKVRAVSPDSLHYPGLFDWGRTNLLPLIRQARKRIIPTLQAAWNPIAEKILDEEPFVNPDEILEKMKKAVEIEAFAESIRKKYSVAIIDEFQDTDAVQWTIFQKLFLANPFLRALYLVGDPKQSIYRFRNADVYIFLQAKERLGESFHFHLDTNFRSSKELVSALNALFSRDWLSLPEAKKSLPFHPVRSGSKIDSSFPDAKGSIHILLADQNEGNDLFEDFLLPLAADEIRKLLPFVQNRSSIAILIKDRHQAEKALLYLRKLGIPAIARSRTPLGKTLAFQAIRELFEAIQSPRDSAVKIVESGPFSGPHPFTDYKVLLEEKGIVRFCSEFLKTPVQQAQMKDWIVSYDLSFYRDLMQIFEVLFAWEAKEGFSFKGLNRFLDRLEDLNEDEGGRRRMENDEEAVQIMTMHASKGLEFEIVFALGLTARTPETDEEVEESNAEKLRQLYVAMTRAKRRLYIPVFLGQKEADLSARSPMELFCQTLEKEAPLPLFLEDLSKKESITIEKLSLGSHLPSIQNQAVHPNLTFADFRPSFPLSFLYSFSSLAKTSPEAFTESKKEKERFKKEEIKEWTLHTMPKGTETGIAIHTLFEKIFTSSLPVWKETDRLDRIVEENLRFSPLRPWKEAICQMVKNTLLMPLKTEGESFSLSELEPGQIQVEMEFLFETSPNFIKGFIDLVFFHKGKYYFLDWKTNWLGENEEAYDALSLRGAMKDHDYPLQASLYKEALRRYIDPDRFEESFGGAFYFFLRGGTYIHWKDL